MAVPRRVLILGGTAEAARLARELAVRPGLDLVTSLAGRTRVPAELPGRLRVGGFRGPAGLAAYLRNEVVDAVIDATHPFAARMAGNVAAACEEAGVPRLKLVRPAWEEQPGDHWIRAGDAESAAEALAGLGERVFLTLGRRDLDAFARLRDVWFLVRLIDPPPEDLPLPRHELLLARGPFAAAAEAELMRARGIQALVSKNAGGAATYGKITAARQLGLPVVMIERPLVPPGETAPDVAGAVAWLDAGPG